MADIRINALATTAASTASDDFIAIDGSANGTRKLNAYSPTFGGNLTVSGTGTSTFGGTIRAGAGSGETLSAGSLDTAADIGIKSTQGIVQGAARIVAFTNGNVLIGTTSNTGEKLQVSGSGFISGSLAVGDRAAPAGVSLRVQQAGSDDVGLEWQRTSATNGILLSYNRATSAYTSLSYGASSHTFTISGTTALTLDSSQNATFAGKVTVNGTDGLLVNKSASLSVITMGDGIAGSYSRLNMRTGSAKYAWSIAAQDLFDNALTITPSTAVGGTTFTTPVLTVAQSGAVTVSGAIAIGNTVQTAASVASTHKVTISIGGSTYYLLATNV